MHAKFKVNWMLFTNKSINSCVYAQISVNGLSVLLGSQFTCFSGCMDILQW